MNMFISYKSMRNYSQSLTLNKFRKFYLRRTYENGSSNNSNNNNNNNNNK